MRLVPWLLVAAPLCLAACSNDLDAAGDYTVMVTDRMNGCNLGNWTPGATNTATVTLTQSGNNLALDLFGTRSNSFGNCTYTFNARMHAVLNGNALKGHRRARRGREVLAYRSMSSRTRAVWLVAVSLVCAGARPALADGALNYDGGKIAAFFIEALVLLAAAVFALILLVRWLSAKARQSDEKPAEPSLPVARAVNVGPPAGNDATATDRSKSSKL